ncbi:MULTISPECIES: hypothetical protein [Streptomyces]|uniref:Uncharacterized protein n=1 Tax=Streptomyces melanosporofaciens TaxID=67327 RepID=A0A1H4RH48_STRMJ|nr:hypothetical protein [Streptomyces melanosporofaciens]SEC31001.1 hypothetical protein SAMN04490356_3660 [Streptomyces melanosporofaciens]
MAQLLGPLELTGDRWVLGDPMRKDGLCVVLTTEGLEHRRHGEAAPQLTVQWSRFVELNVRAAYRKWQAAPGLPSRPGADMGRDGCSLRGIVRHPYDLWSVRYTHHKRRYTGGHIIMLKALFGQLTQAKALDRLGDSEWLGAVVAQLSAYSSWNAIKGNQLVEATIQSLGT